MKCLDCLYEQTALRKIVENIGITLISAQPETGSFRKLSPLLANANLAPRPFQGL